MISTFLGWLPPPLVTLSHNFFPIQFLKFAHFCPLFPTIPLRRYIVIFERSHTYPETVICEAKDDRVGTRVGHCKPEHAVINDLEAPVDYIF